MPKAKPAESTDVSVIQHKDRRTNIPTEELRDFVAGDENKPKNMLYPRDPSLDPQLVWKGKDEQDAKDLEVPAVPIYIQEKIHPKYLIEDLRAHSKEGKPSQLDLFSDFNGIKFEDMVDFYQHDQKWSNRMILGDSLLAMTSLAEKEGLKGKVQAIYIDPPYGIKFGSNWQVSTRKRDVKDGSAEDATRQPEQVKAFRDTWQFGIHSYLAYLRDRLVISRELLTDTGSIFVQIGEDNVHLVRCLLDEVFGSENSCQSIKFFKTTSQTSLLLPQTMDYLLWYAKERDNIKYRPIYLQKDYRRAAQFSYDWLELPDGTRRPLTSMEKVDLNNLPEGARLCSLDNLSSQSGGASTQFDVTIRGRTFHHSSGGWKTNEHGMSQLALANRIDIKGDRPRYVRYFDDFPVTPLSDAWLDTVTGGFFSEDKVYVVQTAPEVIKRCLLMTTDPGDLVIDPTCGAGTTAYVAEQWGRRWITIDTSRVALALARTRLMAAKYLYYLLADTPEGLKKESELTGQMPPPYQTDGDIRKGFVYKRVPHVTLKSITNNPDITDGMSRKEIDTVIARYAETETLYDQPYEDNKRIRVTGPFTVESLSPYRMIDQDEKLPSAEKEAQKEAGIGQFENIILENLKKAGVQGQYKDARLKLENIEPYAGEWLHARGDFTDKDGTVRRVAISIGPEYGTVGSELVKEAAKEAVKGVGFDILLICGFAFDPHVLEESKRYGKLTILMTRMNSDLAMSDELLKKTGSGNLFMVFGEPDVAIKKSKDGQVVVEIKGLDVYDPTTGQVRDSSTADIACWFIDTDYNEESFFVRHAYFLGAEEPYEKLKRALRADIDEGAWSALYSATSRPFEVPKTGKIAVKVINHYGDEVLKVYEVK